MLKCAKNVFSAVVDTSFVIGIGFSFYTLRTRLSATVSGESETKSTQKSKFSCAVLS